MKINFDGVKDQSRKLIAGFCIRDNNGLFISAGVCFCGNLLIIVAEVIRLREDVREVKNRVFIKICIEWDNITTVNVISSK